MTRADHLRQGSGRRRRTAMLGLLLAVALVGCGFRLTDPGKRNKLSTMQQARINIGDQKFQTWLALTQKQRELGLMQVTAEQLTPIPDDSGPGLPDIERGMLFVFAAERHLAFWMRNTITPLDIAYIRSNGEIISTYTMAPLETRTYPSGEPAQFALEVRAGVFARLGIGPGDHVEIPDSVLKAAP